MKNFLLVIFIVFFSENVWSQIYNSQMSIPTPLTQPETNLNVAEPNQVLVVFKRGDQVSRQIKEHYVQVRTIPSLNIVREGINNLEGLDFNIPAGITLAQNGEVIKRALPCSDYNSNGYCDYAAWQFYIDEIATPIANYLNNTYDPSTGQYLKNQIRYIVLCKGIPLKIMSGDPYWYWPSINVSVDGLLCLLNNNNSNPSVLTLYPPTTPPGIYQSYSSKVPNPYFGVDQSYTMNYRFKSNFFQSTHYNNGQNTNWKIAYLVSRLDGRNLNEVIQLIDNSVAADHSGEGQWIIDTHTYRDSDWTPPNPYYASTYNTYNNWSLAGTVNKLNNNGFNVISDNNSRNYITSTSGSVNGYLSWGQHAGMQATYLTNLLNFTYAPGAVFNSIESFNAYSMDPQFRWDNQGMITEFVQTEGTDGAGHTWEPFLYQNNESYYSFPAYAMGYGVVDAMYQGIPKLGWQNVVIGDPLTTITWGKQTLTQNFTWSGTNLVTGKITVPSGKTLTIASNAVINFKHQGALEVQVNGSLVIQSGAVLNLSVGNTSEFSNSVTVPSGATLNITSGATIKFTGGKSLIVNGTLSANQATFTRSGTSGSWNGIVFNQGSSGTIQNCNISYANTGITCNYSLPNINNNNIENNSTGIALYNLGSSSVELTGNTIQNNSYQGIYLSYSSPRIYSNTILNNGSYGISCYNSSPYLYNNLIKSHTSSGLQCNYYSSAYLVPWNSYGYYWGSGNNVIKNNAGRGINAAYWSNLYFGNYPYGGNNSIYSNNSYEVAAFYNSNILAQKNWWGSYPPDSLEFYRYQSNIDYIPALNYDPNSGMQKVAILESNSIPSSVEITSAETELDIAFKYQLEGKFDEAITIYADFINKNFDNPKAAYALVRLNECDRESNKDGFINYINNDVKTLIKSNNELAVVALELETQYLVNEGKFIEAINNFQKIKKEFNLNTYIDKNSIYNTGYIYLKYLSDIEKAKENFDELSMKYPEDELTIDSKYLMSEYDGDISPKIIPQQSIATIINIPQNFDLIGNYPNPFNPSTTISYALPYQSLVEIIIYDIMGKEIRSYIIPFQSAGYNSLVWDGRNNVGNTVTSGVYFYRININSLENNESFTKSAKMLMVK